MRQIIKYIAIDILRNKIVLGYTLFLVLLWVFSIWRTIPPRVF